jgi:hypothetical protein
MRRFGCLGALLLAACGRTGLGADGIDDFAGDGGALIDDLPETSTPPTVEAPLQCIPVAETCNGVDDDCNGKVDEDLPPVPCSGGGFQYCVAGRLSACPSRCDTCIPGSERVCFNSYCLFWGVQTCAGDGQGFGLCREHQPPAACADIAHEKKNSVELQRCCIDHGYCCIDEHDLDGDGDRDESLGRCDEVMCRH